MPGVAATFSEGVSEQGVVVSAKSPLVDCGQFPPRDPGDRRCTGETSPSQI